MSVSHIKILHILSYIERSGYEWRDLALLTNYRLGYDFSLTLSFYLSLCVSLSNYLSVCV